MIKLFRNIRQNLLREGKTFKYLKYGIGEIVLVVIGILIALSINNWNEDRIDKNREKEIVKIIYDELEENLNYIETRRNELDSKIPQAADLLKLTGSNANPIPQDSLGKYTKNLFFMASYTPYTVNLNRIINSEEFNLIRYDTLRTLLGEYEIHLDKTNLLFDVVLPQKQHWKLIEHEIATFEFLKMIDGNEDFINAFDELTDIDFNVNTKDILSNPKFAAIVGYQMTMYYYIIERMKEIKNDIHEIRTFIENHYEF